MKKRLRVQPLPFAGLLLLGLAGAGSFAVAQEPAGGGTARAAAGVPRQDKHPRVDFSVGCESCHEKETPRVVERFRAGAHSSTSVSCVLCHGDGEVEFRVRPASELCLTCHAENEVDFAKTPAKSCFDCHHAHSLKFHPR